MIIPEPPYNYMGEVTKVNIPSLSGTYIYNGNNQTPTYNDLDENAVSISGQTVGQNSGSYEVIFSLNNRKIYEWVDGTKSNKTATWTIDKAQNVITFEPTEIDLNYYDKTGSFVVSYFGDGSLNYSINNDNITATKTGNTFNVTGLKTGNSIITINVNEGTNYLPATNTFNINVDMIRYFTVNVSVDESGGGTVSGGGRVSEENQITVTAIASEGYKFAGWKSNGQIVSTAVHYTFTPTEDITLTASFEEIPVYIISVTLDPVGGGTVTGAGSYMEGSTVTLTYNPTDGCRFTGWYNESTFVSSNNPYTFTASSNISLVAKSEEIPVYTITATIDPENSGTVTGAGNYREGTICTLVATAADGYQFNGWKENDTVSSTNQTYSFAVLSNRFLVCDFSVSSRLPVGYTELQYIHTNGSAGIKVAIDSGMPFKLYDIRTHYKIQINSGHTGTKNLMGVYNYVSYATSNKGGNYINTYVDSSKKLYLHYYGYSTTNGTISRSILGAPSTGYLEYEIDLSPSEGVFTIKNGSSVSNIDPIKTYENRIAALTNTALLGMVQYTLSSSNAWVESFYSPAPMKIFSIRFESTAGVALYDYVPCTNPSGVAGLYDVVNNRFFASTTTTAFTSGPAVEKE